MSNSNSHNHAASEVIRPQQLHCLTIAMCQHCAKGMVLSHLILTTTQRGGCCYLHFSYVFVMPRFLISKETYPSLKRFYQ